MLRKWTDAVRANPAEHDTGDYALRVLDAMRRAERHMIAVYQAAATDAMSGELS